MSSALDIRGDRSEGSVAAHKNVTSLQHVDSLVTQIGTDIGNGRVTGIAQELLNYDPEAEVWQDSPTLALTLSSIFKWVFVVLVWMVALAVLAPSKTPTTADANATQAPPSAVASESHGHGKQSGHGHGKNAAASAEAGAASVNAPAASAQPDDTWYVLVKWVGMLVIVYQIYKHLVWALRLKCMKYKMSSQRLTIESGIFSKRTNTYELHNLSSGQIHSPLFLRMCGRSNLYVGVWLLGVRNAEAVRDLIRNAGQIEASRADKARWR